MAVSHHKHVIEISTGNLARYGFACFFDKESIAVGENFLIRAIELEIVIRKDPKQHTFKIPKNLLIEISTEMKIVDSKNYTINANTSAIEHVKLLSERAGWNQTKTDLEAMKAHGNSSILLATFRHENSDIPLGSGLSLSVSDDISWIGMILVHPELRRQGIARSIMSSCLEYARLIQNKSIVGLDATPQGKQVYDSLGFTDSYKIWRSEIATQPDVLTKQGINLQPFNLKSIREYLYKKNNTERFQIVELLASLPNSKNIMAVSDGLVSGFVMSRPGRLKPFIGPLIANSDEIALSLLNQVLRYWNTMEFETVFIDIPDFHIGNRSLFVNEDSNSIPKKGSQIQIKKLRSFIRMYQLVKEADLEENSIQSKNEKSKRAWRKAKVSYTKTLAYMEKEKIKIIPTMYAIGGPEMS